MTKEVKGLAGYRPKSLEELNSLYDKSINVKNEIDKKASDLEVKQEIYTRAVPTAPLRETEEQVIPEENATEEITGLVDDFIKSFGAPAPVKRVRPVAPATVKAVSSAKHDEVKSPVKQSLPVQSAADKPKLIRSTERNDLFEDYKKVMDDEDDDDFSFHRRGRKRGKKLFERKSSAPAETVVADELEAAAEAEDTASLQVEAPNAEDDIPETVENIDAVIEKVLGKSAQQEIQQEAPEAVYEISEEEEASYEAQEPEYEDETIFEPTQEAVEETAEEPEEIAEESAQAEEPYYEDTEYDGEAADAVDEAEYDVSVAATMQEEPEAQQEESYSYEDADTTVAVRSFKGKNLLLCLLLLVLVFATAVSAVKAFAGINSDTPISGKYHLYSADTKYIQGGIKKGDLVVVVHEAVEEGNVFAYKKADGQYGFAKLDGVLNEDTLIADNDGQKSIVFRNTVRGTIYKTIPAIGTFAAAVASYYLAIIGVLVLLAAILIFVLAFVFRDKSKKATKKAVKKQEVQEIYSEDPQYEDVEGDFSYLVQDENEDGYDVYREEYEGDDAAVYEPDDYKYEPDEYVNN